MSCKHLDEFVQDAAGIDAYRAVHANLISPWTTAGLERKSRASVCMFNAGSTNKGSNCYGRSSSRLHACLHCIHVACTSTTPGQSRSSHSQFNISGLNHREAHSRENNHPLSVELNHGNVYCSGRCIAPSNTMGNIEFMAIKNFQILHALNGRIGIILNPIL